MVTILLSESSGSRERWILRDQPTSEIDNRVIVFENIQTNEVKYVSIIKTKGQPTSFQVEIMQKESR